MSILVMELQYKMKNKHNKYGIMKEDDVIKLLWNKYLQTNHVKLKNCPYRHETSQGAPKHLQG